MHKSLLATAVATALVATSVLAGGGALASSASSITPGVDSAHHPGSGHSSSGRFLVWSRFDDFETGTARLVVSNERATKVVPISHPPQGSQDVDPRISPNGKHILFERDLPDRSAAMIINVDGTGEREIDLDCSSPCVGTNTPAWTPDGKHLLYDRVTGPFDDEGNAASALLWIADLNGNHQRRFTAAGHDETTEETNPHFAPAGYIIVLHVRRDTRVAIFKLRLDGTHPQQLTPWELDADLADVSPARYGPTKNLVVFETYGHGVSETATVGPAVATLPASCQSVADCTSKTRYLTSPTALPEQNFNPTFSPDGRQIAWVRFVPAENSITGDIWKMRWDGSHKRPISLDPRFEFRPAWGRVRNGA